ncbi:MAG: hypothetical protein R3D70_14210 [Rhizobiaceae bacterium]
MDDQDMKRLVEIAQDKWRVSIPGTALGKREKQALQQLAQHGVDVAVGSHQIKNCGPDTYERLEARGFLETRSRESYPDRIGYFVLTPAGLDAWQKEQART